MYQSITLIGNLGSDVEMKYTPSGVAVSNFSLAVSRSWTDANGERKEKVTWFRVACWNKLAEVVAEHLSKGRQCMVVGEIEDARVYTDKQGNARASLEVKAQTVRFLGQRPQGGEQTAAAPASADTEDIPW